MRTPEYTPTTPYRALLLLIVKLNIIVGNWLLIDRLILVLLFVVLLQSTQKCLQCLQSYNYILRKKKTGFHSSFSGYVLIFICVSQSKEKKKKKNPF